MKELSIEEKAKRYDEALEKARNIVNSINVGLIGKDSFEAVFPELKESDDERIRQLLLRFVKYDMSDNYSDDFSKEDCLAWLEKQGEQKPALSEEDEKMITAIRKLISDVKDDIGWNCVYSDDEEIYFSEINNWLKSLKDRVQPQQEKERILGKLEEWLDEYISNLADVGTDTLIGSFRKYLDGKLPVKPQNRWKPSDEQMNALNDVISSRDIKYDVLSELWKDLKKLTE